MKTDREKPLQFQYIAKVEKLMLDWTKQNGIKLLIIECIVPFGLTDQDLFVWFFFDTNQNTTDYGENGTSEIVKNKYLEFLTDLNYPVEYLEHVNFGTDSDENVKLHFEGSYFYRLR